VSAHGHVTALRRTTPKRHLAIPVVLGALMVLVVFALLLLRIQQQQTQCGGAGQGAGAPAPVSTGAGVTIKATMFGPPGQDGGVKDNSGAYGDLDHGNYFAELGFTGTRESAHRLADFLEQHISPPNQVGGSAGTAPALPAGIAFKVTAPNGKSLVVRKRDAGGGAAGAEMDLWYPAAYALGLPFNWSGDLKIEPADAASAQVFAGHPPTSPVAAPSPSAPPSTQPSAALAGGGCPPCGSSAASAPGTGTPVSAPAGSFIFPLPEAAAAPRGAWSQDQGVDIAAAEGTPLVTVAAGTVVQRGIGGFGPNAPVLKLDKPINGVNYVYYGHANPGGPAVGQHLDAGALIGYVGNLGISFGAHLEIGSAAANGTPVPGSSNTILALLSGATKLKAPTSSTSTPGPAGGPTTAATSTCTTAAGGGGYVNLFKDSKNLSPSRIDMGVDYFGNGPIEAPGDADVVASAPGNIGWGPFSCTNGYGGGVVLKLTSGQYTGRSMYVTEGIIPKVTAPGHVTAGQPIATFTGCIEVGWSPATEVGWSPATGGGGFGEQAAALGQQCGGSDPGCHTTFCGTDMSNFIHSTGGPKGVPQGPVFGNKCF